MIFVHLSDRFELSEVYKLFIFNYFTYRKWNCGLYQLSPRHVSHLSFSEYHAVTNWRHPKHLFCVIDYLLIVHDFADKGLTCKVFVPFWKWNRYSHFYLNLFVQDTWRGVHEELKPENCAKLGVSWRHLRVIFKNNALGES